MGAVIQDRTELRANLEKAQRTAGNLHLQTGAVAHVVGMADPDAAADMAINDPGGSEGIRYRKASGLLREETLPVFEDEQAMGKPILDLK